MLNKTYSYCLLLSVLTLTHAINFHRVIANPQIGESQPSQKIERSIYAPIPLPINGEVRAVLSERDIPTGDGGFARDYLIQLIAGEQIAIDLSSEAFDTVVILLDRQGKTIGKNDDGPDGTTNSLLLMRIKDTGTYVIRVQGFGATSSDEFKLKVTKLKSN